MVTQVISIKKTKIPEDFFVEVVICGVKLHESP